MKKYEIWQFIDTTYLFDRQITTFHLFFVHEHPREHAEAKILKFLAGIFV